MIRQGWRNEGWRHSLAAKGIKTNNKYFKVHKKFAQGVWGFEDSETKKFFNNQAEVDAFNKENAEKEFEQQMHQSKNETEILTAIKNFDEKKKNGYMKGKLKAIAATLDSATDDGSNPTRNTERPNFEVRNRYDFAEKMRQEANAELDAAVERGDISYDQAAVFWKTDFQQANDDYLDERTNADQYRKDVAMKLKRVTTPVPVMGVSDKDHGSLLPQKEEMQ